MLRHADTRSRERAAAAACPRRRWPDYWPSESWLSQVERGLRQVDSHSVLVSLAEILRVDVGELTGDEPGDPRASQYAAAREIERAMMAYDALESVILNHSRHVCELLVTRTRESEIIPRHGNVANIPDSGLRARVALRHADLPIASLDDDAPG